MTPLALQKDGANYTVPCGKCPQCVGRRISAWSFRLIQEDKRSTLSSFITLTYDTSTVPITERGFMVLCKRDLQLFFKRLRKSYSKGYDHLRQPIKYYAVGEYGGKGFRPHYHVILFNCPIELIQPAWNKGHVHYGQVSGASIGYTLKYMCKPRKFPLHQNDDRISEFALMSKRLGDNYLSRQMLAYHKADTVNRLYCTIEGGQKISMPRYYKDKIYTQEERGQIKAHWSAEMQKKMDKQYHETAVEQKQRVESQMAAFRKMYADYYKLKVKI